MCGGVFGADTALKTCEEILTDEIEDAEFLEFAIENFSEMMWYRERQAQIKRQATTMIRISRKKYLITVIFSLSFKYFTNCTTLYYIFNNVELMKSFS